MNKEYLPERRVFDYMNEQLLNPNFLRLVEKWARYDGKEFWIGGMDIYVKNMGTFTKSFTSPKIEWSEDHKFKGFSKTETETTYTTYDVTKIRNNAVCSDYNTRILIAEIEYEASILSYPKLYIYAITDKKKPYFPNFKQLKLDFESGKYIGQYNSLLYESVGSYKLMPFNNRTDRIHNYTGILGDLEALESDEEAIELSKHIIIPERITMEEKINLLRHE